jgi:hypothetical protein
MNGFAQAIAHNKGRWFKAGPRNNDTGSESGLWPRLYFRAGNRQ